MASFSFPTRNDMPEVADALNLIAALNSKIPPLSEQSSNIHHSLIKSEVSMKSFTSASGFTSQMYTTDKINKLKKRLDERKRQEWKELENSLRKAKEKAEIIDRINYVNGFLKRLNYGVHRTPKCEELNLPMGKVSAMKARWEEFENEWNNPSSRGDRYCARDQSVNGHRINGSDDACRLSELTGWLDEFAKKDKALNETKVSRPAPDDPKTRSTFYILPDV